MNLGRVLKNLRIARGLTRQDMVNERYSVSHLAAVEQGVKRPSVDMVDYLTSQLEFPLEQLCEEILEEDYPTLELIRLSLMLSRRGRGDHALAMLRRAGDREKAPESPYRAELLEAEAEVELLRGNAARARELYDEARRARERGGSDHLIGRAYYNLGRVEYERGDFQEAHHWFFLAWDRIDSTCVEHAQLCRDVLLLYGDTLLQLGQYRTSRLMYERLLSLDGEAVDGSRCRILANWGLGRCLLELGDYRDSIRWLSAAAALARDFPGHDVPRAAILTDLGVAVREQGDLDRARVLLEEAVQHRAEACRLRCINELLECLLRAGISPDEADRWRTMVDPDVLKGAPLYDVAAHHLMEARLFERRGDYREAQVLAMEAYETAPETSVVLKNRALGVVLATAETQGDTAALEWIRRQLEGEHAAG